MTKRQCDQIIKLLRDKKEIPHDYKHMLFPPERKEYEMVYSGKEREEDILADTMAVPLQSIRTFGSNGEQDWSNILVFGDNLQAMKTLLQLKEDGKLVNPDGSHGVKLAYIDPPFATKREFRGSRGERAYQDKVAGVEFLEFLRKRLVFLRELLSPNGSLYVHLDWRKGHYLKILLDEVFGEHHFQNEIIWQRTSARSDSKTYNHIHDMILFYGKGDEVCFTTQYTPYDESYIKKFYRFKDPDGRVYRVSDLTARGVRRGETGKPWRGINPTRIGNHWKVRPAELDRMDQQGQIYWPPKGKMPGHKRYLDEGKGVSLQSIWTGISPVHYVAKENYEYPTQKPEKLLERIVSASTEPGDIVLDSFAGSGTTLAVAEKLGRRWIGIDSGKLSVCTIQKRLLNLRREIGNKGRKLKPKPFTLYNAGLYDFSRLKQLPWKDWRFFALNLFQCRDEPHKVAGMKLDGYRGADDVLVFNHMLEGGVVLDHGFIDDIHNQVGGRLGSTFFIVAPAASVTFLEDYIEKGRTRYYVLRIPYSIINELHTRDFEVVTQPMDESQINDIVEAVGFDFIQMPEVNCEYFMRKPVGKLVEKEAVIRIETFKSRALVTGATQLGNRESLSMVMVDYDYPHEKTAEPEPPPFEVDEVFYSSSIEKDGWEVCLTPDSLGEHIMISYIDIFGNEYTEVRSPKDFKKET